MKLQAEKLRQNASESALLPQEKKQAWRALLRDHAEKRWRSVVDCLSKGKRIAARDDAALVPLISALGSQGEEALQIVDRFALGSATEAFAAGETEQGTSEEFDAQLEIVMDAFAQAGKELQADRTELGESEAISRRPQLFQSELWQLLYKVRESAELYYTREVDVAELDRRILFLLYNRGPLVPAAISAAAGVDKAQVSRSVKRLLDLDTIERDQIRSPVALTTKGKDIASRLLRLAELRNRELGFDISDRDLADFFSVVEILLDRSIVLYEREREIARASGQKDNPLKLTYDFEERRTGEPVVINRQHIVSPLMTLSAYLSRSGALAFKRLIGLSNFETWVLSEISYDPPTDWPRLVKALERDHSQAGRTVNHLVKKGLVVREGGPARRHGRFTPSEEGQKLYDVIVKTGEERAKYLMEPVPAEKLGIFTEVFDKLARNASAQLMRERALEEMENG